MGETRKVGKGGTENGPAILPIANSFEIFCLVSSGISATHSRLVVNHNSLSCNFQLYTLGHSPICVNEVEIAGKLSI
jgi:hypothetical protein